MSFLVDRAQAWLNKSTSDPEAEAALQRQQAAIKSLISEKRKFLNNEKSVMAKAKVNYNIEPEDAVLLSTFIDAASKYLDEASSASLATINTYFVDNFDKDSKYSALCRLSYAPGSYPNGEGQRRTIWEIVKAAKQAKQDNPEAPAAIVAIFDEIKSRSMTFLSSNPYAITDVYNGFNQELNRDYFPTTGKNDAFIKLWTPALNKIKKNNGLDFPDPDGGTVAGMQARLAQHEQSNLKKDATKDQFDTGRMLMNAVNYTLTVAFILVILFVLGMGASMAVNLNIYRTTPYRIFYAIYGCVFGLVVVPYVLLYRWWWKGKQPRYYGFIPIIPRFFVVPATQFLLGWLTYRPDEHVWDLQEWREAAKLMEELEKHEPAPTL
jgi:hypothetical protein